MPLDFCYLEDWSFNSYYIGIDYLYQIFGLLFLLFYLRDEREEIDWIYCYLWGFMLDIFLV